MPLAAVMNLLERARSSPADLKSAVTAIRSGQSTLGVTERELYAKLDQTPDLNLKNWIQQRTEANEGNGSSGGGGDAFASEFDHFFELGRRLLSESNQGRDDVSSSSSSDGDNSDADEGDADNDGKVEGSLSWNPPWMPEHYSDEYSWLFTVYFRLNGAQKLYEASIRARCDSGPVWRRKIHRFQLAHIPLVNFMERHGRPLTDVELPMDFGALYKPLGNSCYPGDQVLSVSIQRHQIRRYPIDHLRERFTQLEWDPELIAFRGGGATTIDETSHLVDGVWNATAGVPDPQTHRLYYAVLQVLRQCRECIAASDDLELCHNLWLYYVSFVDFFLVVPGMGGGMSDQFLQRPRNSMLVRGAPGTWAKGDEASPWQLYGRVADGARVFSAEDLPDLYHVLADIPLRGEQYSPAFLMGKIYQKCLPFACHRRHLSSLVYESIRGDLAFWGIFSKMAWTTLANLYPGDLWTKPPSPSEGDDDDDDDDQQQQPPRAPLQCMQQLVRLKQITDSRPLLLSALNASNDAGGPLLLLTFVRMHILYMGQLNPQYVSVARQCIDWDHFRQGTLCMAEIIRSQDVLPADSFAQARLLLGKTVKGPNLKVHRLHKHGLARTLAERFNETFEKKILSIKRIFEQDLPKLRQVEDPVAFSETVLGEKLLAENDHYAKFIEMRVKALHVIEKALAYYDEAQARTAGYMCNVLNQLICVPRESRLSRGAFELLMQPDCGGVSLECVDLLCSLVHAYHTKPAPREMLSRIDLIHRSHFWVACYFLNVVCLLEKIDFEPLDATTVRRTDAAMALRVLETGGPDTDKPIPAAMYTVCIALCCDRICTLMGQGKHGNKRVTYNVNQQAFICIHGKNKKKKRRTQIDDEVDTASLRSRYAVAAVAAAATAAAAADKSSDSEEEEEEEEEDDADGGGYNQVANVLEAEASGLDMGEDFQTMLVRFGVSDLASAAARPNGVGGKRSRVKSDRKAVRNERKQFSRIPCGQPVLNISLRGRMMLWGDKPEKRQRILFCPQCAALHVFSDMNFAASESGLYRCNECARAEMMHDAVYKCAYCERRVEKLEASVELVDTDDRNGRILQRHYFCRKHARTARRYAGQVSKARLWELIKRDQEKRMLTFADRGRVSSKK